MDPKETKSLNPLAIFSKTGKGVQEASGKTSHLSRADRAVLAAIDGKTPLSDISAKFDKLSADKFDALIQLLDKDGFVREVSSGQSAAPTPRPAAKAPAKAPPPGDEGDDMDFTQAIKLPSKPSGPSAPKAAPIDLAAAGRADAERRAKEAQATDYRARQEAEAKAKAEAELKARAAAEAKAKAEAEAKARAEAEAKARAESDARTRAEADAKVKSAREAAVRMATEAKAKAEADAKAKTEAAEREKAKLEAELNAKLEAERKAREEAEKRAAEAAEVARRDLEEKAKRDAEKMRQRLEAEMKAKLEEERKAREAEDRKRREEEDRRRKEEDEKRAKEEAERRAREEAERKKREEEDRKRKEEDARRRKEEDERRAREESERKKREEEDRKRREEDERRRKGEEERRAKEDAERRARDESERRARDEAERRSREEAERRSKEESEAKARAAADQAASLPKVEAVPPAPPPAPAGGDLGDLLGDLESFGKREEEEQKAKEEAEREAKEAAARKAKETAERKAKEEAERKRQEEDERRRKEEEERRAQEEAERKKREEEERRDQEEAERKRKAKEALAAKKAEEKAAKAAARSDAAGGDDDLSADEDLDADDIKRDRKAMAARTATREQPLSAVVAASGRPRRWGKPVAIALFVLLVGGIGALQLMPVSTADYEKVAAEALGVPVKIGSARMSVITGIELKFENVSVGDAAKIRVVRGVPEIGSLFGGRKAFTRVEMEGVTIAQSQIADALLGKAAGSKFSVARVLIKQLSLDGPLKLPPLDVDAALSADGTVQSVRLTGNDKLLVQLAPKGGEVAFEISAGSFTFPFVPGLNLADFGMKGTAGRSGISSAEFDGRAYDGVISGTAKIRWGANWTVEGEVRARAVKVAVFAPALVSEGKVEGRAAYTMSGSSPAELYEKARLQGEFKIEKGVLGSFDLTRALQTGGAQSTGRTVFNELTGHGVYDKGAVQLRDMNLSAGAMNAGASLDIDANGGLAGRIAADVKTPNQTLRAVLILSGKLQDPVVRK